VAAALLALAGAALAGAALAGAAAASVATSVKSPALAVASLIPVIRART
jgi:hypothetical protein